MLKNKKINILKKNSVLNNNFNFIFAIFDRISKNRTFRKEELAKFKKSLDWAISIQAPKIINDNGEGSTTIPEGSRTQVGSKRRKSEKIVI